MARVKRSVNAKKKRREVLEQAKGYRGLKKNTYKRAKEQMLKSLTYAYRDRRARKRDFRRLWIVRINAGARQHGLSYNQLMHGLKLAEIDLDRKVLSDLAVSDPAAFQAIAESAKAARAAAKQRPGRRGRRWARRLTPVSRPGAGSRRNGTASAKGCSSPKARTSSR